MKQQFDEAHFHQLAEKLMFNLDEAEYAILAEEFKLLTRQLALLEALDTTGISPCAFPVPVVLTTLRPDIPEASLSLSAVQQNAATTNGRYISIGKVIK